MQIILFVDEWLTTTIKLSKPVLSGRSVMKSQVTCKKERVAGSAHMGMRPREDGWVLIFICWQMAHPATKFFTKTDIPGHQ